MAATTLLLLLINSYGVNIEQATQMTCLAIQESNLNQYSISPINTNKTRDYGLFQINSIWAKKFHIKPKNLLNLNTNIKIAIFIYKTKTIAAWATAPYCF